MMITLRADDHSYKNCTKGMCWNRTNDGISIMSEYLIDTGPYFANKKI